MKVLCIHNGPWKMRTLFGEQLGEGPDYGEICTIVGEREPDGYLLQEYPHPRGYRRDFFIPLSDIDERELVEQRESNLVER